MKNIINILLVILAVILQTSLIPLLSNSYGTANLILIMVICLVFINRTHEALIWVFWGGILLDMISPFRFGVYFFSILITYLIIYFLIYKPLFIPNLITIFIIFILSSIIFDLWSFLFDFSTNNLIKVLYNATINSILGMIIYYFLDYYFRVKEIIKL